MASLVEGFNFLDQHVSDYSFFFRENLGLIYTNQKIQFPYFLVNIGSGVSILKFNSEKEYERVGGTSLGGGTFLGMCNLLIGTNNFDELLELAQQGHSENADLLIKDIYRGSDSPHTNLKSENLAVSLGKLSMQHLKKIKHIKKEDIAKSLLVMVAFNIS
jgi:type II pantothenate kinase